MSLKNKKQKNRIPTPHDRLFKYAMKDLKVAQDFFRQHLPTSIQSIIKWDSFQLKKESYLDENLKTHQIDVLYSVNFEEVQGYIYLLVEHQSTADRWMPFRLLNYAVKIMSDHLESHNDDVLPLVYPIVFYNGESAYSVPTDLFILFGQQEALARKIWLKPHHLIDLNQIPDEKFRNYLWAGTLSFVMKHARRRDFCPFYLEWIVDQLLELDRRGYRRYIIALIEYIFGTNESNEPEEMANLIQERFLVERGDESMTVADYFIQKGLKQGKTEGIQKGLQKGLQKGIREGYQQGVFEIAKKLLKEGLTIEFISKVVQLSPAQLQLLSKENETV